MTKIIKSVLYIFICLVLGCSFLLSAYAENENKYYSQSGILCISYRGDTAEYEKNSKEAVLSAFEKGADFVSVNIRKSADGEFVLCSENEIRVEGILLKEILSLLNEDDILILDFDAEYKDEIYELLKAEKALSKAHLRIKDSEKNLNEWISSKEPEPTVIGVCSSFNIFTVQNFVQELSYMPAVQLQSKNYFNVMYGSLCYSRYGARDGTRAIAPMYDPDKCGQRSDSEDGWNDLIKKNFSVIETNNLEAFIKYRDNIDALREELSALLEKAESINDESYSLVSRENLRDSIENAKALTELGTVSCDELQKAHSSLLLSINSLTYGQGEDTRKGALNITPGKVIAAVLVGALILAAQIYVHKMQREKKR